MKDDDTFDSVYEYNPSYSCRTAEMLTEQEGKTVNVRGYHWLLKYIVTREADSTLVQVFADCTSRCSFADKSKIEVTVETRGKKVTEKFDLRKVKQQRFDVDLTKNGFSDVNKEDIKVTCEVSVSNIPGKMSDNISKSLPNLQSNDSDYNSIYGENCYNSVTTYEIKLGPMMTVFNKFNYNWKVACVRSDEEKKFIISAEMTSRYVFEDMNILTVYLKNKDETLLTKEFSLDKSTGKSEFEIEFLEEWSVPFEKIKVSAVLRVKEVHYYRSDWATQYNFKDENRPHDIVLVVGETKFYVFRNYLATWSRFFDRLFYGDFKEKNQKEIKLEDVDANYFERILGFLNPQLYWKLDESIVLEILKLADRFEISNLMARCGEILCNFDKCKTLEVLDRLELADNHNLVSLQIACFERIHKMEEKARSEFFDTNRRRIQNLSNNVIKNLI